MGNHGRRIRLDRLVQDTSKRLEQAQGSQIYLSVRLSRSNKEKACNACRNLQRNRNRAQSSRNKRLKPSAVRNRETITAERDDLKESRVKLWRALSLILALFPSFSLCFFSPCAQNFTVFYAAISDVNALGATARNAPPGFVLGSFAKSKLLIIYFQSPLIVLSNIRLILLSQVEAVVMRWLKSTIANAVFFISSGFFIYQVLPATACFVLLLLPS